MRPGQNKRSRGRNGGGHGGGGGGGGGPHQHRGPRPPHRIQTFDSNGPNVKIRGNAYQVFERYLAMAREAQTSGDRVAAENFYQHAEHYFRLMQAAGEGQQQGQQRSMTPADTEMNGGDGDGREGEGRDGENRYGEGRDGDSRHAEGRHAEGRNGEGRNAEGRDGDGDGGQPQAQVHTTQPPQPPMPAEPGDEQRGYRDDQPPYRDDRTPGF